MRILILGGYGVFGGRLVELLSDLSELEMIIAGRSLEKAERFCRDYRGEATVAPLKLDRDDFAQSLPAVQPDIVVDASGPFQDYGDDPYSVVTACIGAGVSYLDFADGADFVRGISAFDTEAKEAGVFVLSGVSSFPVLTAAVLREIALDIDIVSITGGIAPSPYAGIGLNVMKAVIGYAGGDVRLHRDGQPAIAKGLAESRRYTIAPPGKLPVRNLRFSLVDVPDLQLIPIEYPELQNIWMGAGPVPETLHLMLNALAKLRALLRLPSLRSFAPLFFRILNLMKFGEHRGGMFIHVEGRKNGVDTVCSWHLLAEGEDGPYIPSMAIEGVVRKVVSCNAPQIGARPATNVLELADYEKLFEQRDIFTGFRSAVDSRESVFQQILGEDFENLPSKVREFHAGAKAHTWSGKAKVKRGKNPFARLISRLIGFPEEGTDVSVSVTSRPEGRGETWIRNFGGKEFSSHLTAGKERNDRLLTERFGPISVAMALVRKAERLYFMPRRWSFLGMPLPGFLMPRGNSYETDEDGAFQFCVEIRLPVLGLLVSYKGWLQPEEENNGEFRSLERAA